MQSRTAAPSSVRQSRSTHWILLLLLVATPAHADDLTWIAEWTWSTRIVDRQPRNRIRETREGQPLYLWLRFRGEDAALDHLREQGKLPIVAQWFWYPLDSAIAEGEGELIDPVNLSVGRKAKVAALEREIRARGWFDWITWSVKRNAISGFWEVRLVYADNTPVLCTPRLACSFTIEVR